MPERQSDSPSTPQNTDEQISQSRSETYGDEKFRKLSRIQPCAQGLWLYLITGPHTKADHTHSLEAAVAAAKAGFDSIVFDLSASY